jgi:hypothetical protein
MKRKIDINKINELLEKSQSTPKQLAEFIDYPITNLTLALGNKHKRKLPMDYLISVSEFFKLNPKDLTISINKSITNNISTMEIENNNKTIKEKI